MAKIDEIMAVVWDLLGDPHFKFVEKELRGKISAILASPEQDSCLNCPDIVISCPYIGTCNQERRTLS